MYTYTYICTCIHVYIYKHIHICMYTHGCMESRGVADSKSRRGSVWLVKRDGTHVNKRPIKTDQVRKRPIMSKKDMACEKETF